MSDDPEIVGDEEVGETEPFLELLEQVQHLRLDRDVQRRDRLVEDEPLRVQVAEALLLVLVLAVALIPIPRLLRSISTTLGKIAFGVRAIKKQPSAIEPGIAEVGEELKPMAGALTAATKRAEERTS